MHFGLSLKTRFFILVSSVALIAIFAVPAHKLSVPENQQITRETSSNYLAKWLVDKPDEDLHLSTVNIQSHFRSRRSSENNNEIPGVERPFETNDDDDQNDEVGSSEPRDMGPFSVPKPPLSTSGKSSKPIKKDSATPMPSYCHDYRDMDCTTLPAECIQCNFNTSCVYGDRVTVTCSPLGSLNCQGDRKFSRTHACAYCYQLPAEQYQCYTATSSCRGAWSRYKTSCLVNRNILCLGKRQFPRYKQCNFISGYRWSTALFLSVTLGGFGVDRFYLGNWQEGIGKLFSFGGLGVWTLIDIILIATGYLKPADGSRYIF